MTTPERPSLRCLGGVPARPELVSGIVELLAFPDAARARVWTVLGPSLAEPVPKSLGKIVEAYAKDHGLEPASLARALRSCRAVIRGAALQDMDGAAVALEAAQLSEDPRFAELLAQGYEPAKAQVRGDAIRAAMQDHGAILDGVTWRLDRVVTSSHEVGFSVALMTLKILDRGHHDKITFQVPPERLRELQVVCERLLGPLR